MLPLAGPSLPPFAAAPMAVAPLGRAQVPVSAAARLASSQRAAVLLRGCRAVPLAARAPRRQRAAAAARAGARACAVGSALILSERKKYTRGVGGDDFDALGVPAPDDYYSLLRVQPGASFGEIKAAFRVLAKAVHPDVVGAAAHDLAIVLNLANATLTEEATRLAYDAALRDWRARAGSFDGQPVSVWAGTDADTDATFVSECLCIGCGKCVHVAPNTFELEPEYGRARVHTQWGDSRELIAEAIATCPVETISYVKRSEVALLEFMMKSCHREDVSNIARRRSGNFGPSAGNDDPFAKAAKFLMQRRNAAVGADALQKRAAQDDALAAAIAKAWLALDPELRARIWPEHAAPLQ